MSEYYFIALSIPGYSDSKLHMTLAVVPMAAWDRQSKAEQVITLDSLAQAILPLSLALGESKMFGPNKDVPVRLVEIPDASKRSTLETFALKWHAPPDREAGVQEYHVTIKGLKPGELDAVREAVGTRVIFAVLGNKGPPLWSSQQ